MQLKHNFLKLSVMDLVLTKGDYEKNFINWFLYFRTYKQFKCETTMSQEGQYIFNSLGFYLSFSCIHGSRFLYVESGLVTTKSVSTIAAKNIGKFAICSLIFFLVGYNLAYGVPEGPFKFGQIS